MYEYRATLENAVDADTVDLAVDVGFHVWLRTRFRLHGIDAPESGPERARGRDALVELIGNEELIARTYKPGKYGRWLADLWVAHNGLHINTWLVDNGFAKVYVP